MDAAQLTGPVAKLREDLDALERAYSPGHHGTWAASRRAEMFDDAIVALFERADPVPGVGVAALGGYGRGLQLPRSDVDLLIVHDGVDPDDVAALAERLLYPLWDGGFEIGHAVRTPSACVEIAGERLDVLTSMLDLRALAGDRSVTRAAADGVRMVAASDPAAFARALRADAVGRAVRYGATTDLLEPDLKQGAGGLRDLHAVGWITSIAGPALLRTAERAALAEAEDFLTRVRSALHLETGRRADRLPLELQPPIARVMGFVDEPGLLAEDALMRGVYEHARTVRWVTVNVLARAESGAAMPQDAPRPFDDVDAAVTALADVAASGSAPDARVLDSLEATALPEDLAWTEVRRAAFLRILRSGDAGVTALEALDRLGWLAALIPAWAAVRCRPQRDPYHRFTVDAHLTAALAEMGRLLSGAERDDDDGTGDAVAQIRDPDALLLGAFLHDIGKTGRGGHVVIGAQVARETLAHMGVGGATGELAAFMVAEHLVLPDTATRRDLTDENLILDVAARIGTPERLAALSLLARADAAATGPAAWTPWRRTLVRELVARVQRAFERGDMGAELAQRLATRVDEVRELLAAEPPDEIDRFVLRMPRAYFLAIEPARIAEHHPTISPDVGTTEVRTAARSGSEPGTYALLVVAADRPGLLSWIAGALALAGLSILSAQAFTTDDGVAVDLFEVHGVFEAEVDEARWREVRQTLRRVVEGRISLDHLVAQKRSRYRPPRSATAVTVTVDNDVSDFSTVVEVGAPDRIGLLYDVTSALADLTLDVHLAKVATYTDRVIDVFYVRDALGRKVLDRAQLDEIVDAIGERLDPAVAGER